MGVPMIGCTCDVCLSADPRDNRSRPSILVRLASGATILVDTSSDLRAQALRFKMTRIDAVLYTHSHADHILGLDELRRFNTLQQGPIPLFGDERTLIRYSGVSASLPAEPDPGAHAAITSAVSTTATQCGRRIIGPLGSSVSKPDRRLCAAHVGGLPRRWDQLVEKRVRVRVAAQWQMRPPRGDVRPAW